MKKPVLILALLALLAAPLSAQQLTSSERAAIDSVARAVLTATGAPSASIAIVRGGQIVYEHGSCIGTPATASNPGAINSFAIPRCRILNSSKWITA